MGQGGNALAEHAARSASAEDIEKLRAALSANEAAVGGDPQRFIQSDIDFHYALAQIPRNPVITALHIGIAEWLADQRLISIHARGSVQAAIDAHARIFDAVAAHDPIAAGEAMRDHLAQVATYYWSARDGDAKERDQANNQSTEAPPS